MSILRPKFLTEEIAMEAVTAVMDALMGENIYTCFEPKRKACHIVVLVPEMKVSSHAVIAKKEYPKYPITPHLLYERSVGDRKKDWTADYQDIARCKALQLWHGRNDGRTDVMPHLLYSGDCPFWGGVKRDGIVVACSGVEPWFDRMIAGMVADICIAAAYDAWMKSNDKKEDLDNLS